MNEREKAAPWRMIVVSSLAFYRYAKTVVNSAPAGEETGELQWYRR
jgi:hypothetical protein